jgi:hypothetical protein
MQSPELPLIEVWAEDHHCFPLLSGNYPLASPGVNRNTVGQGNFSQLPLQPITLEFFLLR